MSEIKIEWLRDEYEYEDCGVSYAEGANVFIDGNPVLDLTPAAHCYNGQSFDQADVLTKILEHLGHTVEAYYAD